MAFNKIKAQKRALPARAAAIYAIFGVLWILLSDRALNIFLPTPAAYNVWQSIKGGFFVLLSAALIYSIISGYLNSLHESEQQIAYQASLIHDVSDALIATDLEGRVTFWNEAAHRIYGWSAEEVLGKRLEIFTRTEYVDGEDEGNALKRLFEDGHWQSEVTQARKDGARFPVISSVALVRGEDGYVIALVAVNRDISERKQAEQALQTANDLLEERVRERTGELHEVNLALESASKLKDEFLAGMSHELRTPLNAVISLSESMREGVYGRLTPAQERPLGMIEESGNHLLTLINDILDLAKIEAGKFELYYDAVPLDSVCQSALRMMHETARKKNLTLSASIPADLPVLHADGRRLKQMLVNLLSNAVKFTPGGGAVTLEVTRENEHAVRFAVRDTGVGIPPEKLPLLFKPFSQLDGPHSKRHGGTGLGLALVRQLADMHEGSVGVESVPGQGSTFHFILPLAAEMTAQEGESAPAGSDAVSGSAPPAPGTVTILLAEDNEYNRMVTSDYLTHAGYRVVLAQDGVEAIEQAEAHHPHVIVMDVQMPGMNGLDVIRALRNKPEFASTPMIAFTALAMPGDRERCLEAGADAYLAKPASMKNLSALVGQLLSK
jgi:PAS domain S-box-containing protein